MAMTIDQARRECARLRSIYEKGTREDGTPMAAHQLRSLWMDIMNLEMYILTAMDRRHP